MFLKSSIDLVFRLASVIRDFCFGSQSRPDVQPYPEGLQTQ